MGGGNRFLLVHQGILISSDRNTATVSVDTGSAGNSCVGCALKATCGKDEKKGKSDSVTISAVIPEGTAVPEIGSSVSVGLPEGSSFKANLIMLVLPLAVLLLIAILCDYAGLYDGISALAALGGAALCYTALYIFKKHHISPWILIPDNKI